MELVLPETEAVIEEGSYKLRVKPVTTTRKAPEEQQIRDTFWTPNYAVDLLVPFIPKYITHVWECAAGGRKISRRLEKSGYTVLSTDLKGGEGVGELNFLTEKRKETLPESFSIITNPPFSIKDLFVDRCFEYGVPFALLINADYSQQTIRWIKRGCEKIIPLARIAYITPNIVKRINEGEGTSFLSIEELPMPLMYKYSNAQFHSMWLCYKFNLGKSETFVDLSVEQRKNNI